MRKKYRKFLLIFYVCVRESLCFCVHKWKYLWNLIIRIQEVEKLFYIFMNSASTLRGLDGLVWWAHPTLPHAHWRPTMTQGMNQRCRGTFCHESFPNSHCNCEMINVCRLSLLRCDREWGIPNDKSLPSLLAR